jgi:hypothetical protein
MEYFDYSIKVLDARIVLISIIAFYTIIFVVPSYNYLPEKGMWGLFAGFARKQPPHLHPTPANPGEPAKSMVLKIQPVVNYFFGYQRYLQRKQKNLIGGTFYDQ